MSRDAAARAPEGPAPIALVAYKRPLHTLQTLYSLSRCPEAADSELYVFCDGPRQDRDRRDVERTREVVSAQRWCGRVHVERSDRNLGLSRSVAGAVSRLCEERGRVIVIEDDLLLSRGFLAYMNEGLRRYVDDDRVMSISGHTFDVGPPEPRAVLLPLATTWGWATWARAWAMYQEHPRGLERLEDRAFRRSFDLDGAFDYTGMLRAQMAGHLDSWGIRWWWSVHDHRGLGLFPRMSLVKNIGADALATNTREATPLLESSTFDLDNAIAAFPAEVRIDPAAFEDWKACLRRARPPVHLRARASRLVRRAASHVPGLLARLSGHAPGGGSATSR